MTHFLIHDTFPSQTTRGSELYLTIKNKNFPLEQEEKKKGPVTQLEDFSKSMIEKRKLQPC